MEYTKGKWHATNSAFSRWNTYRGKVTGARTFVTVGIDLDQVAEVHGDTDEECEANAHLIAAAPAMYEALKAIIDAEKDGFERLGYGRSEDARKALAEAEGK